MIYNDIASIFFKTIELGKNIFNKTKKEHIIIVVCGSFGSAIADTLSNQK